MTDSAPEAAQGGKSGRALPMPSPREMPASGPHTGCDWHIIEVTSTYESAACAILDWLGYPETFYPQRKVVNRPRRRATRPGPRYRYRAWVPGYVFLCAEHVACHIINGQHGRVHMRVLSPGGVPYRLTDEDMARMADVPQRVQALVDEARAREAAERAARRPVEGEPARIISGPFAGATGVVEAISGGVVQVLVGAVPVRAEIDRAERIGA